MDEVLSNGLVVSVDWLSFTLFDFNSSDDVIRFMGIDSQLFREMEKGASGYKRMRKCAEYNISVLFEGNKNMGIHVTVSSRGVGYLLDCFSKTLIFDTVFGLGYEVDDFDTTALMLFFSEIQKHGQLTRIDLAVDDIGCRYYSLEEIQNKLDLRRVISKFRTYRPIPEKTFDNDVLGYTIYFGSRESDIMMRVYDKRLEQNRRKSVDDVDYVNYDWIRWELEIKGERSNDVVREFVNGKSLSSVIVGVLSHYVRFVVPKGKNRSRWKNEKKWDEFISGIEPLRLFVKRYEPTIDDKIAWLEKQVAPTMATVLYASGGNMDLFNDMATRNESRMSAGDKQLIEKMHNDFDSGIYYQDDADWFLQRKSNNIEVLKKYYK